MICRHKILPLHVRGIGGRPKTACLGVHRGCKIYFLTPPPHSVPCVPLVQCSVTNPLQACSSELTKPCWLESGKGSRSFPPGESLPVHAPWEVAQVQGEATCPVQENAPSAPTPVSEQRPNSTGSLPPKPRDTLSLTLSVDTSTTWPCDCLGTAQWSQELSPPQLLLLYQPHRHLRPTTPLHLPQR